MKTVSSLLFAFAVSAAWGGVPAEWTHRLAVEAEGRAGVAHFWVPEGSEALQGLLIGKDNLAEVAMTADPRVRDLCRELGWGIVFLRPAVFGLRFDIDAGDDGLFTEILQDLGAMSGVDSMEELPFAVFGHSASGPWAQQVAYAFPERVVAVVHYKSGNLLRYRPAWRGGTISEVPFLVMTGEFEEFGPDGPLDSGESMERQWYAARDDLRSLRAEGYRAAQAVLPGEGHFGWSEAAARVMTGYLRDAWAWRQAGGAERELLARGLPSDPKCGESDVVDWWIPGPRAEAVWQEILSDYGGRDQAVRFEHSAGDSAEWDRITGGWSEGGTRLTVSATAESGGEVIYRLQRGPARQTGPAEFTVDPDLLGRPGYGSVLRIIAVQRGDSEWRRSERAARAEVP
ncbi:MAG: alpha/beta hydrolase [Opitutales bacterium]|nr:alpha/beta hydrolase [Opitutales bacterium]